MAPKPTAANGTGGPGTNQPSLLSFFKKAPASTPAAARPVPASSSSLATPPLSDRKKQPVSHPAPPQASKVATPAAQVAAPKTKTSALTLTPPITSDDLALEDDDDEHGRDAGSVDRVGSSSSVARATPVAASSSSQVPSKRSAVVDSEEEDDGPVVAPSRKRLATSKPKVVDSDDEDEVAVKGPKKAKKAKKSLDDDDFALQSDAESEDYFKDDLNPFLIDDDDEDDDVPPSPVKPKPKPKPAAARPALKKGGSGGGTSGIKTQAELLKLKEKETKKANEEVFDFLVDPKDADGIRPGEEGYDPRTLYIPKKAWAAFTPFERQFWEVKATHYDTVLFFQKGKFFELYEEDASIGHREFDLKLTDRVKMRMVGVPESSFDFWAAKFLAQGYKVGRVDQCETALGAEMRVKDGKAQGKKQPETKGKKNEKAIVRRELKSVYTSGTIVDGSMLTDDLSNHCVAIKEDTPTSSSPPTFGVCVLDASTAEFSLSSFEDDVSRTALETLIRQLKPKELIHEKANLSVSTLRLLRNTLSIDTQWTALKKGSEFLEDEETREELRKLFRKGEEEMETDGVEDDDHNVPENIKKMYGKPLAMSALGGMIWYLRQLNLDSDLVTAKNFNIYDPIAKGKALLLDGQTLAHIEVLQNSQGGVEGTLLQLLSRCVTPFGKRLFKIWLCAPLREAADINDRLDAVDDLLAHPDFGARFDQMAKALPDLERMLSRIHAKSCKKQEFLKVVEAFEKIASGLQGLAKAAAGFKSKVIQSVLRKAPEIAPLLDAIKEIYEGDELLPVEGMDDAYETVRQNVVDIEDQLQAVLERAKVSLKCNTLVFRDIGTKDIYQIQVPVKIKVPNNWTQMSNTKEFNRYYSPDVAQLVQDLKEARERKTTVVNEFQFRVYGEFDKDYSVWMDTIRLVAELDCLLSLSKSSAALGEPAVRPEMFDSDTAVIEFEELRHPCIVGASTDFIPNDVKLGGDAEQMILLTGPNMAGKSTMLRMTCAAIIMAQLGCYVPAVRARISPIDAIFSRMGANDFIFANASTFKVEMDDCQKILTKSTPKSLVILDELGRGTSTYDGMAIAYAVLHRLATHVGCIGFFATHFTSLTEDFAYHPQIRLCNMETRVDDNTRAVVFLYKLVDGSSPRSYGPHVASMAGLPEILVKRAIGISKEFETSSRAREREMRAHESLPLTSQADAAFLMRFAALELKVNSANSAQLLRTLAIIRAAVNLRREPPSPKAAVEDI